MVRVWGGREARSENDIKSDLTCFRIADEMIVCTRIVEMISKAFRLFIHNILGAIKFPLKAAFVSSFGASPPCSLFPNRPLQ